MKEKTIIIVGGGQAAAMAAASLRQQGFTGELHLFSDEQHLPYERPRSRNPCCWKIPHSCSLCYPLTGGRKTRFICIPV